jgi:hypothetical protein
MSAAQIAVGLSTPPLRPPWSPPCPPPVAGGLSPRRLRAGRGHECHAGRGVSPSRCCRGHRIFDFVAGCDSGFGAKPDPGMCLAFAAHLGHAPDTILMVGDSLHDLTAGRAAGMRTVGVLTGIARRRTSHPSPMWCCPTSALCPPGWPRSARLGPGPRGEENDTACRGLAMSVRHACGLLGRRPTRARPARRLKRSR